MRVFGSAEHGSGTSSACILAAMASSPVALEVRNRSSSSRACGMLIPFAGKARCVMTVTVSCPASTKPPSTKIRRTALSAMPCSPTIRISPAPSRPINGACPRATPRWPSNRGSDTDRASVSRIVDSGVTITQRTKPEGLACSEPSCCCGSLMVSNSWQPSSWPVPQPVQ